MDKKIAVSFWNSEKERLKYWSFGFIPFMLSFVICTLIFQIEVSNDDIFYLLMLSCILIVGLALFSIKFFIPSNAILLLQGKTISINNNEFGVEKIGKVYILKYGGLLGSYHYSLDFSLKDGVTYPLNLFPFVFRNTRNDIELIRSFLIKEDVVVEFHES